MCNFGLSECNRVKKLVPATPPAHLIFLKLVCFLALVGRCVCAFLAHLSRRLGGAYSIGRLRRPSVVHRPSTISNDFTFGDIDFCMGKSENYFFF